MSLTVNLLMEVERDLEMDRLNSIPTPLANLSPLPLLHPRNNVAMLHKRNVLHLRNIM
jgi:hypothetical protein